jgi:hypothetical protein
MQEEMNGKGLENLPLGTSLDVCEKPPSPQWLIKASLWLPQNPMVGIDSILELLFAYLK